MICSFVAVQSVQFNMDTFPTVGQRRTEDGISYVHLVLAQEVVTVLSPKRNSRVGSMCTGASNRSPVQPYTVTAKRRRLTGELASSRQ